MFRQGPVSRSKVVRCSHPYSTRISKYQLFLRASQLLLSILAERRAILAGTSSMEAFSTSTPARTRSTQHLDSFSSQSPVETQPVLPLPPGRQIETLSLYGQSYEPSILTRDLEKRDEDAFAAGRSCFEAQEYAKVEYWLKDCESPKAKFLKVYSRFIVRQL